MFKQILTLITVLTIFTGFIPNINAQATFTSTFPDVKNDNQYYSHINNLKEYGIVNGYANGNFGPENSLTRGEMSKFVKNAIFGKDYTNTSCSNFGDNSNNGSFFVEIYTLKCEGVVNGYSDGLFHPERSVSRGEATKFVINGLRKKYKDEGFLSVINDPLRTKDVDISNTFYDFIYVVYYKNMMKFDINYTNSTNYFRPNEAIIRGEMAELVWNGMQMRNLKEFPKNFNFKNVGTIFDINNISDISCITYGYKGDKRCFTVGDNVVSLKNDNFDLPEYKSYRFVKLNITNKNAFRDKKYQNDFEYTNSFIDKTHSNFSFFGLGGEYDLIDDLNIVYPNIDKMRATYSIEKSTDIKRLVTIHISAIKGDFIMVTQNSLFDYYCEPNITNEVCIQNLKSNLTLKTKAELVAQELVNAFAI